MKLAFDKGSVRSVDKDGRLHVSLTNISKAAVNGYLGSEIPLEGLIPDKVYRLLRHPEELAKAASTFNNIQILGGVHAPVSAEEPQTQLIVGSTGTDAVFNSPYLQNSIVLWDADAIAGVEDETQKEISCAYRYIPIMQSGEYEGEPYDGIMTNIIGNHVSLVPDGRAGSDVVVGDSSINFKEITMTLSKKKLLQALKMAQDANLDELVALLQPAAEAAPDEPALDSPEVPAVTTTPPSVGVEVGKDAEGPHVAVIKSVIEALSKLLTEETAEPPMPAAATDEFPPAEEKDKPVAMDAALKRQRAEIQASMRAIAQAEKAVQPLVGELNLAFDSANDVYKEALSILGIETKGIHPSAYKAIFDANNNKPVLASDQLNLADDFAERFPGVI